VANKANAFPHKVLKGNSNRSKRKRIRTARKEPPFQQIPKGQKGGCIQGGKKKGGEETQHTQKDSCR